jgi:hypothetical protein
VALSPFVRLCAHEREHPLRRPVRTYDYGDCAFIVEPSHRLCQHTQGRGISGASVTNQRRLAIIFRSGGVVRFRPPQGLGIVRTRRLGIYPASLAFVPQESAPALRESWGRSGVEVPRGCRHHSDVGSRSADPIKFCVKGGLF